MKQVYTNLEIDRVYNHNLGVGYVPWNTWKNYQHR